MDKSLERLAFVAHNFRHMKLYKILPKLSRGEYMLMGLVYYLQRNESMDNFFDKKKKSDCMENKEKRYQVGMGKLAKYMKCSVPAVSKMVRSMEEKELVERVVDRKDRRNTFVELTAKGDESMRLARTRISQYTSAIVEKMGEDKINQLSDLLEEFYKISEQTVQEIEEKE